MKKAAIFALLMVVFYSCGSNDRGELVGVKVEERNGFQRSHSERL